ncbi:MAG: Fe-S cluster assembly protein IscX [Anaerolineales bacterium]|jgi:FeS assembly protein IscX
MTEPLNWESTFAIALALAEAHPAVDLTNVSLNMIYAWTVELEGFDDDRALANDEILSAIYQDWFEHKENLHDPQ